MTLAAGFGAPATSPAAAACANLLCASIDRDLVCATQVPSVAFPPASSFTQGEASLDSCCRAVTTKTKEAPPAMTATPATLKAGEQIVELKLAHSPDSDDAFMFYALATHKLATPGYKYTHVLSDIQTLNEAALTETYDVTAISFAAYPSIRDKYVLLDCGASFEQNVLVPDRDR